MPNLQVDTLSFSFGSNVDAEKYDSWQHHVTVLNALPGGRKAMDVVAIEGAPPHSTTWLIEVKDFRVITNPPKPSNIGGLAGTVFQKVTDTIAGLGDASQNAVILNEKQYAARAISSQIQRVVLHLEPHIGPHTALFPIGFAANVLQKLRQLVKSRDPNPLVLNIASTPGSGVPWTVT